MSWVFGLSIDDYLSFGLAEVNASPEAWGDGGPKSAYFGQRYFGNLAELRNGSGPPFVDLAALITEGLRQLQKKAPDIARRFEEVEAVGVSSIGLIDRRRMRLVDIRRKPWAWEKKDEYVLDIRKSVVPFFPRLKEDTRPPIAVHNDATAKCMAYRCFQKMGWDEVLCLVMLNIGVNIGISNGAGPLSSSDLHPEMGHGYPVLHPDDIRRKKKLAQHSGCPIHTYCYEGVASGGRIENEWLRRFPGTKTVSDLPDEVRKAATEILSHYMAQLCWTTTLAVGPSRILLAGSAMWEGLLPDVRAKFMDLARGHGKDNRPYLSEIAYPAMANEAKNFIQISSPFTAFFGDKDVKQREGIMGALELGRHALRSHYVVRAMPESVKKQ